MTGFADLDRVATDRVIAIMREHQSEAETSAAAWGRISGHSYRAESAVREAAVWQRVADVLASPFVPSPRVPTDVLGTAALARWTTPNTKAAANAESNGATT